MYRSASFFFKACLIPALVFVSFAGCGYRFAGSGEFPAEVTSVFVSLFDNRTAYPGAENIITNSLLNELSRRGGVRTVEKASAEAVLSGTIKSISTVTVSHADPYTSAERRLILVLDVTLSAADGEILWAADNIRETIVFAVTGEGYLTEQSQEAALSKLAADMAEKVYNRLTENF